MKRQLAVGCIVGLSSALLSWSRNHTPHLVSTFPDGISGVMFIAMIALATRDALRRQPARGVVDALHMTAALTLTTAVVLALGVALQAVVRLAGSTPPHWMLGTLAFVFAFVPAIVVGALCAALWTGWTVRWHTT